MDLPNEEPRTPSPADISPALRPGEQVDLLLRQNDKMVRAPVSLVTVTNRLLIMRAPYLAGIEIPPRLTVLAEDPEHWVSANLRIVKHDDTKIVANLEGAWMSLDRRRDPRTAVDLPVRLLPRQTRKFTFGKMLDVSATGAAIEVAGEFPHDRLRLRLTKDGFSGNFDCDVVGTRKGTKGYTILHLMFRTANAQNSAVMRCILPQTFAA